MRRGLVGQLGPDRAPRREREANYRAPGEHGLVICQHVTTRAIRLLCGGGSARRAPSLSEPHYSSAHRDEAREHSNNKEKCWLGKRSNPRSFCEPFGAFREPFWWMSRVPAEMGARSLLDCVEQLLGPQPNPDLLVCWTSRRPQRSRRVTIGCVEPLKSRRGRRGRKVGCAARSGRPAQLTLLHSLSGRTTRAFDEARKNCV
jgi:hypothetical protein